MHADRLTNDASLHISISINFRKKAQPVNPAQLHIYKSVNIKIMMISPKFI